VNGRYQASGVKENEYGELTSQSPLNPNEALVIPAFVRPQEMQRLRAQTDAGRPHAARHGSLNMDERWPRCRTVDNERRKAHPNRGADGVAESYFRGGIYMPWIPQTNGVK